MDIALVLGIIGMIWFHVNFEILKNNVQPAEVTTYRNITLQIVVEHITTGKVTNKYILDNKFVIVTYPFNDTYILSDETVYNSINVSDIYEISYPDYNKTANYVNISR